MRGFATDALGTASRFGGDVSGFGGALGSDTMAVATLDSTSTTSSTRASVTTCIASNPGRAASKTMCSATLASVNSTKPRRA